MLTRAGLQWLLRTRYCKNGTPGAPNCPDLVTFRSMTDGSAKRPTIEELERAVEERPNDARALVSLANAYWLEGRGPEIAGELALRARDLDPDNRGAWHMWALTESSPRKRVGRWCEVVERFPTDDLAKVLLADNAASLAGAEHDQEALDTAIKMYEELFATAEKPEQKEALDSAIRTLKSWRL